MIQQNDQGNAGLEKTTALCAESGPDLFPLFYMPVRCTDWSVEPGDGCRGLPHHGAIRFGLPAQLRGASPVLSFSSRLPMRDSRGDQTIAYPSGPMRAERTSSSTLCSRPVRTKRKKQESDPIPPLSTK
jgi:hypothetical protein